MLLKVHNGEYKKSGTNLQNMLVSKFPEMVLFKQSLRSSVDSKSEYNQVIVIHHPPTSPTSSSTETEPMSITIPLQPPITTLFQVPINLHGSKTNGFDMGEPYNDWFTACFGYPVKLVYLGPNLRRVLGNVAGNSLGKLRSSTTELSSSSWLPNLVTSIPILGSWVGSQQDQAPPEGATITFADCAPYLVVTEKSLADVSRRMSGGEQIDITKFRPNIVVDGGADAAWEEDFWGGLAFRTQEERQESSKVELELTANCGRCVSLNVDYASGRFGKGEVGSVLKMLSVDRRVDPGHKYSPVCP